MHPKDAERIVNSVDPDQTATQGAVWSRSALFAKIYLSENLGSLQYPKRWLPEALYYLFVSFLGQF